MQVAACAARLDNYVVHWGPPGSQWCAYRVNGIVHVCDLATRTTLKMAAFVPMSSMYVRQHTLEFFSSGERRQLPLVRLQWRPSAAHALLHHPRNHAAALDMCGAMLLAGVPLDPDVVSLIFCDARWSRVAPHDEPVDALALALLASSLPGWTNGTSSTGME